MIKMTFIEWCEEIYGYPMDHDWYSAKDLMNFIDENVFELVKAYEVYCGRSII